jgi:hypothetical protein
LGLNVEKLKEEMELGTMDSNAFQWQVGLWFLGASC